MAPRQIVNILQACALVGVSRRTIYNWINAGKVEYVRTAGGAVRIYTDSLYRDAQGAAVHLQPTIASPHTEPMR